MITGNVIWKTMMYVYEICCFLLLMNLSAWKEIYHLSELINHCENQSKPLEGMRFIMKSKEMDSRGPLESTTIVTTHMSDVETS